MSTTPELRDVNGHRRAAAALVLAVAEDRAEDVLAILGCNPGEVQLAASAYLLADWLVLVLRRTSLTPEEFARRAIELENAREATS